MFKIGLTEGVSIIIARQQQKGTAAIRLSTLHEGYSLEVTSIFVVYHLMEGPETMRI